MVANLRAVFSHPAPEVTEAEYNAFYDFHVGRILTYDGFVGNRRYRLTPLLGTSSPAVYEYLSLYEIDRDPVDAHGPLRSDVTTGTIDHPDWFRNLVRSSWSCYELDHSPTGWLFDHLYLVLSSPPDSVDQATYAADYQSQLREHLLVSNVTTGGRFTLASGTTDDAAPSSVTFLALYGATVPLDAEALVPGGIGAAHDDRFVVLQATAASPARYRP